MPLDFLLRKNFALQWGAEGQTPGRFFFWGGGVKVVP